MKLHQNQYHYYFFLYSRSNLETRFDLNKNSRYKYNIFNELSSKVKIIVFRMRKV